MTYHSQLGYARHVDTLMQTLVHGLVSVEVPSLATFVSHTKRPFELDYVAGRELPLQLTMETGRPCGNIRHKQAEKWIRLVESAFGYGRITELHAIVPAGGSGAPLSALYPRLLGECVWGRGAVWELLRHQPADLQLSVTVSGAPTSIHLASEARARVRAGLVPGMATTADLEPAANLISTYWVGFCTRATPWLVGGGISKLAISGTIDSNCI